MRDQGQYAEPGINPMVAAQMQHMSAQRLQHPGNSQFVGRDLSRAGEDRQYMTLKAEGGWQWDRDTTNDPNQLPEYSFNEEQGNDVSRSSYDGQRSEPRFGLEKQAGADLRAQTLHSEVAGYEDNTLLQTIEGLEQKFLHDILKLSKEQQEAEDVENARHRERLSEINLQYHEKLLVLRARQATHREEFLRKESQARHQQFQQARMSNYQNNVVSAEAHSFASSAPAAGAYGEAQRAYAGGHYESYGERPEFVRGGRGRGLQSRGQYPGARAYNSGGRYF
ncbi:uncharacterized protein [Typha angustifolia]|uniref:uncharacterized protein n=1 Tax=Typha angustifolia TaxID=59011 RepID=UPI003C2C826B